MNGFKIDIVVIIVLLLAGGAIGAWLFGSCGNYAPETTTTVTVRDTIIVRDTVRAEVPVPRVVEVVRYDTIHPSPCPLSNGEGVVDTPAITIPIEQKEYVTADYRAVVEGYRPRLVDMEIYRQMQIISDNTTTTITKNPRWAVTLGVGAGWTPQGLQPYVGATFGYVIWSR